MRLAVVSALLSSVATWVFGQVSPEPWGTLGQYGAAGFLVGVLIWRYERSLGSESARADRAESQRDELVDRALADLVPLVTEVSRTMVPTIDRLVTEVQRMGDRIERPDRGPRGV